MAAGVQESVKQPAQEAVIIIFSSQTPRDTGECLPEAATALVC